MKGEKEPLSEKELKRLDELALTRVAAGMEGECPECSLDPMLVVRLVSELRTAHAYIDDVVERLGG